MSQTPFSLSARAPDAAEAEVLLATLCLGLCAALKASAMTTDGADARLFSPYTMRVVRALGLDPQILDCVHAGTELGDLADLVPGRSAGAIAELEQGALEVLRRAASKGDGPAHWLATDAPLPPLEDGDEDDEP